MQRLQVYFWIHNNLSGSHGKHINVKYINILTLNININKNFEKTLEQELANRFQSTHKFCHEDLKNFFWCYVSGLSMRAHG